MKKHLLDSLFPESFFKKKAWVTVQKKIERSKKTWGEN
jgi:hypothetical protein